MDQLRKDGYALGRGRAEAQRLVERDVQRRRILMRGAILVQWRRRSLWKLRLGSAAKGPWARLFSRYLLSHMRAPRHGREVDSAKDPTRPPSPRAKLHATPLKHRMSDMYVRWLRPRAQSVPPRSALYSPLPLLHPGQGRTGTPIIVATAIPVSSTESIDHAKCAHSWS